MLVKTAWQFAEKESANQANIAQLGVMSKPGKDRKKK